MTAVMGGGGAWGLFGPGWSEDRVRKEMDRLRGGR